MRQMRLDVRDLRTASVLLLGAAAVVPVLPGHDELTCPLRAVTGVPCPLCGMTTSVTNTVRLDLHEAVAANPAGVFAIVAAILLLTLRPRRLALPAAVIPVSLAAMWVWQLVRFSIV